MSQVARGNPPPSGEEGASDFTASSRWARAIASIIAPLDSRGYPPLAGLETEPQCNAPAARAPGDTRGPARGAASRIASKASAPFIRFSTDQTDYGTWPSGATLLACIA